MSETKTPTERKKTCTKCTTELPVSKFTVISCNPKTGKKYYQGACKACCNARNRARYVKKPRTQRKISTGKLATIQDMLDNGDSKAEITRQTGICYATLRKYIATGDLTVN